MKTGSTTKKLPSETEKAQDLQQLLEELRDKAVGKQARRIVGARCAQMKRDGVITEAQYNYVMGIKVVPHKIAP